MRTVIRLFTAFLIVFLLIQPTSCKKDKKPTAAQGNAIAVENNFASTINVTLSGAEGSVSENVCSGCNKTIKDNLSTGQYSLSATAGGNTVYANVDFGGSCCSTKTWVINSDGSHHWR